MADALKQLGAQNAEPSDWVQSVRKWMSNSGAAGPGPQAPPSWGGGGAPIAESPSLDSGLVGGLAKQLGNAGQWAARAGQGVASQLGNIPRPSLPGSPPPFNPPSFQDFHAVALPSADSVRNTLLVVVIATTLGVGLSLLLRMRPQAAGPAGSMLRLPPLDLSGMVDREKVVRLFEYAALQWLGEAARPRHHHRLATDLEKARTEAPTGNAERLAEVYEKARYAPPDEPFPDSLVAKTKEILLDLRAAPRLAPERSP
jgi:hypothetical protein